MNDIARKPCPKCGEMIAETARLCRFCRTTFDVDGNPGSQQPLPPQAPGQAQAAKAPDEGDSTGGVIPYKNPQALAAYYCGIFSVIPCFIIGLAGLFLGLRGLKNHKENPKVSGLAHAWIGIVLGAIFGITYTILTVVGIAAAMTS